MTKPCTACLWEQNRKCTQSHLISPVDDQVKPNWCDEERQPGLGWFGQPRCGPEGRYWEGRAQADPGAPERTESGL